MTLRETLKKLMEERELRQSQLARSAGISKAYLWQLLNEEGKSPSAEKLDKIARVLGVTVDDILHPEAQKCFPPEKKYMAHCARCRSVSSLMLVPHGAPGQVNGWLFACPRCEPFLVNGTVRIITGVGHGKA